MPDLRTTGAVCIFVACLVSYTCQTELAAHARRVHLVPFVLPVAHPHNQVQQTQGYRKPAFLLYLTHSGYALILPLHLLALRVCGISIPASLKTLRGVLRLQFSTPHEEHAPASEGRPGLGGRLPSRGMLPGERPKVMRRTSRRRLLDPVQRDKARREWKVRLGMTVLKLTLLIALPAGSWYSAVPLTSMTDLTSLYNTFAFWAYLLSCRLLGERATRTKLAAVLFAVCGVFVISYGDSFLATPPDPDTPTPKASNPLLGNLLALIGSMTYAFYEVWYKLNVSLPFGDLIDSSVEDEADALLAAEEAESAIHSPPDVDREAEPEARYPSQLSVSVPLPSDVTNPSAAIVLFHGNFITGCIGLCTMLVLAIPLPFLHWVGWEEFELPPRESALPILGIILAGVLFNAGFMLLLSLWGPIIASVGNLLTLILVGGADAFISGNAMSKYSLVGSGMVVAAFAMLVVGARDEPESGGGDKDVEGR